MRYPIFIALCLTTVATSTASPRIESNSLRDRLDMSMLRDSNTVESSILTWPWPIGRTEISRQNLHEKPFIASHRRLERMQSSERKEGIRPLDYSLSLASERQPFRSFGNQPREEFEASIASSWLSEWTSGNLQVSFAENPSDGEEIRLDGTYFSVAVGNWFVALDQVERWWGPGWDGSLILSNNARPIPAISLTRISPDAFENRFLKWIGPWTFTTFMGQLDNDEGIRPGSDALLFGMRIDFSPFGWDWFDIGLSRTGQWAGQDRPSGLDTFWRLLLGEDNRVNNVTLANEPGNQLAGMDYRWKIKDWRFAHYGQVVGEDEETYLPDANMLLFGVEHWGELKNFNATWRVYYEWADTRAGYLIADPRANRAFNVAYNHGIYETGYRYKGRSIGHAMDGDGLMRSIGAFIVKDNGDFYGLKLRNYAVNRDGVGPNSVSIDPLDGSSIELTGEFAIPFSPLEGPEASPHFRLQIGVHYIDELNARTGDSDDDIGGSINFSRRY